MARKDVEEYYNLITNDYQEMVDTLKEMEELAAQDIVNPDRVDDIKKMIEPLKNNYSRVSYIMYLLNLPQRDSKKKAYAKQNQKFFKQCDTSEHEENKRILSTLNDAWTGKLEDGE